MHEIQGYIMQSTNATNANHDTAITVCLNMIVKNEAHIIRRTLDMLLTKIRFDYWVICDTGSTDATREIIQEFFEKAGIEGELHCDEWVNFAHNRTLALNRAFGKTDLLLVFDADDDICGTIVLPSAVTHDEYHLKFGAPNFGTNYTRTLLINNRKRFQYHSVVHEYISCLEPSPNEQLRTRILGGDYFVVSGRSGARNQDPDKYLKDALLLEKAHAEAVQTQDPLCKRYAFYCGNSYRDCGRHEDAIRWYKITLAQDNWAQEKYVACLYMYQCYEALNQKEHGFFYLVKAFAYDLERVECVYPLLVHYCCEGMNHVAYNYYRMVEKQFLRVNNGTNGTNGNNGNNENNGNNGNNGKLFLETDKANFFVPYYMIIVADRVGDRACGIRMYEIIFRKKQHTFSAWHLRNLMFNLRFFIGHVKPEALNAFAALANNYVQFIRENGVPLNTFNEVVKDFNYETHGINLLNQPSNQPSNPPTTNFSRSECKRSRTILFYTGYSAAPWNCSSMNQGALGGSEKAVAYLSQELCRNGYTVYVSGGVESEDNDGLGRVKYVGLSDLPELLRTTAFHTVVCSRYISFLELYGGGASWYQFYVWAHDTHLLSYGCDLSDTAVLEKWADRIDGCVCQTQWHADEYARQYPTLKNKIHVINNGIAPELFPAANAKKVPNRFIYTSRTERGLSKILDLWPDLVAALPDATLAISTYVAFPCNDDERRIQARIASLNQMRGGQQKQKQVQDDVQVPCIRHLGQLNPAQLYSEMGEAEFWLYPTDWPETSCITAMEMLMSEVTCLYYPVAGLTDTMAGCGIQVAPGTEVETLMDIVKHDDTQRMEQREQGRAYAESCSWANRAQQWVKVLDSGGQRVAIVNSLPYHYEMFGYILNYFAKKSYSSVSVTIFTEIAGNNWGWLDFYKDHFKNKNTELEIEFEFEFECKSVAEFDEFKTRTQFDVIFVPTDDDMGINTKWIDERFIVIEHTPQMRRSEYHHRIAVRPFRADSLHNHNRWALPCYEIVGVSKKMDCILHPGEELHVALIGGYSNIDVGFINRLTSSNGSRVKLHCIGSCWRPNHIMFDLSRLNKHIELVAHGVLYAYSLIEELKMCDYVITDVVNEDHIAGKSMSGSIPLAFSTLTPLIMGKQNNSIYKFRTAVEVDLNSSDPIILEKPSNDVVSAVALERDELVRMAEVEFDRCMQRIQCMHPKQQQQQQQPSPIPKRVMQTWEHKRLGAEFQAIVDTWKTHNPHYEFVMMDAEDREQFIRAHFQQSVIDAYARIIPGAYKSDLFRYCYLWVNGGVYADIDTLCLGSLDDFLVPGAGLVVPIDLNLSVNEGTHNLACGFIAVIPQHPAMMRCIQIAVRNVQNATVPRSKLDFTGPGVLGRAVNECLCNDETESFVGKEGLRVHDGNSMHFLKFEPGTELVKDMKHQVLFQNKNGNRDIANLYHAECCKLKDFVSWVQCASPFETLKQSQLTQPKNIALMIYGQFRTYATNLRENIRMLAPLFGFGNMQSPPCRVHVFILSNKLASGNYSERNETEIRGICDDFGFNVCFFDYVENLGGIHAANERAAHDSYFSNVQNNDGINNEFIPAILYRKFALNQIKNEYCNRHNIDIDLHVFGRLFDVMIKPPPTTTLTQPCIQKQIQYEIDKLTICSAEKLTVLGSSDTLFIGTQAPMDHLFECAMHVRGPEIWNDPDFLDTMMRADSCLCANRATYSPEVQYIARVHFSNFKYRNIRFDFNNPDSPANHSSLYDIRLDPNRLHGVD